MTSQKQAWKPKTPDLNDPAVLRGLLELREMELSLAKEAYRSRVQDALRREHEQAMARLAQQRRATTLGKELANVKQELTKVKQELAGTKQELAKVEQKLAKVEQDHDMILEELISKDELIAVLNTKLESQTNNVANILTAEEVRLTPVTEQESVGLPIATSSSVNEITERLAALRADCIQKTLADWQKSPAELEKNLRAETKKAVATASSTAEMMERLIALF
jgi:septal ring factor EnvC (AmiA/AmiB activator)